MQQQLVQKVIEILDSHPELIDYIVDESSREETYSLLIYRPMKEPKHVEDFKMLQLTGFKIFVEFHPVRDSVKIKIYEIEFLSQRGQFPKWAPTTGIPYEQIIISDLDAESKDCFDQFRAFQANYNEWKATNAEQRFLEITEEFINYETALTFDDPFQEWVAKTVAAEEASHHTVESYQGDSPDIMDFERKEK